MQNIHWRQGGIHYAADLCLPARLCKHAQKIAIVVAEATQAPQGAFRIDKQEKAGSGITRNGIPHDFILSKKVKCHTVVVHQPWKVPAVIKANLPPGEGELSVSPFMVMSLRERFSLDPGRPLEEMHIFNTAMLRIADIAIAQSTQEAASCEIEEAKNNLHWPS